MVQQEDRATLTREAIVAAGIELADRHGMEAVSIRRIAAQLGSSPMALYHYVPSKSDLLNLILDAVNAEFAWPERSLADWRSTLSHFARESRRCLKRHPWVAPLRAADPEYGPECIQMLEILLETLSRSGLDMRTAMRALGAVFVFVNGFVGIENGDAARQAKGKAKAAAQPRFSRAVLATGRFPHVTGFAAMGAEQPDDDGFERGLKWILDGIAGDLAAQKSSRTARQKRAAG
jgi:AcrR family transcriptional regulator